MHLFEACAMCCKCIVIQPRCNMEHTVNFLGMFGKVITACSRDCRQTIIESCLIVFFYSVADLK